MAQESRGLTEATLLAIHAQQVERFGGAHGVLDQHVVQSTLTCPLQRWSNDETADLADFAAAYLVGFAQSRGFNDGNKRTGLACALVFLALNGAAVHVASGELYAMTMAAANNTAGNAQVAAYLRGRLP